MVHIGKEGWDCPSLTGKQLKQEQNTDIDTLNNIKREGKHEIVEHFSRMEFLQLPKIDF